MKINWMGINPYAIGLLIIAVCVMIGKCSEVKDQSQKVPLSTDSTVHDPSPLVSGEMWYNDKNDFKSVKKIPFSKNTIDLSSGPDTGDIWCNQNCTHLYVETDSSINHYMLIGHTKKH